MKKEVVKGKVTNMKNKIAYILYYIYAILAVLISLGITILFVIALIKFIWW